MSKNRVVLVDGDVARRTQIGAMLESAGLTVAAYKSASHYNADPSEAAIVLIADEKRALQSMTIALGQSSDCTAIIAFRSEPAVHDVVEAMKLGAADYLAWPFGPTALLQRLGRRDEAGPGADVLSGATARRADDPAHRTSPAACRDSGALRERGSPMLDGVKRKLLGSVGIVRNARPRPITP